MKTLGTCNGSSIDLIGYQLMAMIWGLGLFFGLKFPDHWKTCGDFGCWHQVQWGVRCWRKNRQTPPPIQADLRHADAQIRLHLIEGTRALLGYLEEATDGLGRLSWMVVRGTGYGSDLMSWWSWWRVKNWMFWFVWFFCKFYIHVTCSFAKTYVGSCVCAYMCMLHF